MKKNVVIFLAMALLSASGWKVQAQLDTVFWFAAPDISASHAHTPIKLQLSSNQTVAVTGTVTMPANPAWGSKTINIPANGKQEIVLATDDAAANAIENEPANTVNNKGLLIKTSLPVNCYYESALGSNNPEIYALKGKNALGTDFMITGQTDGSQGSYTDPVPYHMVDIVATENGTTVTITPKVAVSGGHAANVPFNITLNKGQTYCFKALGISPAYHLHGSIVTSNKPIALTVTDDCLSAGFVSGQGCADQVGDQIVPTSLAGTEFLALRSPNSYVSGSSSLEHVYIFALEPGTQVRINGVLKTTLNTKGASYNYGFPGTDLTEKAAYIETSKPALVYQLTAYGCEMGGTVLPALKCTGSNFVSYTRWPVISSYYLNVLLVVEAGKQNGFRLNNVVGSIPMSGWTTVSGTGGTGYYMYQVFEWSNKFGANETFRVSNSSAKFHMSVLEGSTGGGTSYGFFTDYSSFIDFHPTAGKDGQVCENDSLTITIDKKIGNYNYIWTGPDNYNSTSGTSGNLIIENASTAKEGWYLLHVEDVNMQNCEIYNDSVFVEVVPHPVIDLGPDIDTCLYSVKLTNDNPAYTYEWSTGETTKDIVVPAINLPVSQDYSVTAYNKGCYNENSSDTIHVNIYPSPEVNFFPESMASCDSSYQISTTDKPYYQYLWNTGDTTAVINVTTSGLYSVTISSFGCENSGSKRYEIHATPTVHVFQEDTLCENGTAQLQVQTNGTSITWSTGDKGERTRVSKGGVYWVSVSKDGCTHSDSITVTALPLPTLAFELSGDVCSEGMALLTAKTNGDRLVWNTGETTPSIVLNAPGTFAVTVSTDRCSFSGEYPIICPCKIWVPNAFTPGKDGINDQYHLVSNSLIKYCKFSIYDRHGTLIFYTNSLSKPWDGTFNKKALPSDMYSYILEYQCENDPGSPKLEKGTITLIK